MYLIRSFAVVVTLALLGTSLDAQERPGKPAPQPKKERPQSKKPRPEPAAKKGKTEEGTPWIESTFDRIYLKNGSVLDGHLLEQSDKGVLLKVQDGTITLSRARIIKIERLTIRNYEEEPQVIPTPSMSQPTPTPVAPSRTPTTGVIPDAPGGNPLIAAPTSTVSLSASEQAHVQSILNRVMTTPPAQGDVLFTDLNAGTQAEFAYVIDIMDALHPAVLEWLAANTARVEDSTLVARLVAHSRSTRSEVRKTALIILDTCTAPGIVECFIDRAESDSSAEVRLAAVNALSRRSDPAALPILLDLLSHEDAYLRQRAASGVLRIVKDRTATGEPNPLPDMLASAAPAAQAEIALLLGQFNAPESISALTDVLTSPDPDVRKSAVTSLGTLKAKEALPNLLELLSEETAASSPNAPLMHALCTALQGISDSRAVATLIEAMGIESGEIRTSVSRALRQLTGQRLGDSQEEWAEWYETQSKGGMEREPGSDSDGDE